MLVEQMLSGPRPVKPVIKASGPPLCPLCPEGAKRARQLTPSGRYISYCQEHNKEVSKINFQKRQQRMKEAADD
jgi:hypothetical protein